jgi:hypothetical protein
MVVCEVPLSRLEQLLLVVACELRPALAAGNPPVASIDSGREAVVNPVLRHL